MLPSKDDTPVVDKNTLLVPVAEDRQLTLRFSNINAWVSTELQQPSLASRVRTHFKKDEEAQHATKRQILHHIGAEMRPGEVFSLMGPSGSGKSTLLSVISGRPPKSMNVKGDVLYNGQPLTKAIKKRIGFVLQDDVLYESLTVHETLYYAAMLRLPKDMAKEEKQRRVDSVLDSLGLRKCQDTIIGGFFRRGVSGGERKRVSIGHELLINPSILMLDEPTSGLDSTTAMHLLVVLRQLATGGRAVLTTIHQPSSRLYQQLDKLLLLAEGHAIYYGAADKVVTWFSHLGYELPYGINVADFILDLAMGEELSASKGAASGKDSIRGLWRTYEHFARANPQGFHHEAELRGVELLPGADVEVVVVRSAGTAAEYIGIEQSGAAHQEAAGSPSSSGSSQMDGAVVVEDSWEGGKVKQAAMDVEGGRDGEKGAMVVAKELRSGASYWDQLSILLVRSIKTRRFEALSGQRFLQLVLVALITGMFWWQKGGTSTTEAASDTIGLLFFELLFPAFSAMFSALFTFPNDYRMLLKERASGMYQLSAYYIARVASDFPLDCTYPTLFCIIMYWMGGLRATPLAFFCNWLTLILVVLIAQSLGLLVGATCMDPKTAQTITTVIMLAFMLVGGYYVRNIPVWISWVKYLSFIYWGFNLLIKIEFNDRTVFKCESGLCRPVPDVQDELNLPVSPDAGVWPEVVVLMGMLVVLRLAVYIALKKKTAS